MPAPSDKMGLVRLLGMVQYLAKFCANLSDLVRPLRDLLKEDTAWGWDAQQQQVLNEVKEKMSKLPIFRLFDHNAPIFVSVDASPVGVGAVLCKGGSQ